MKSKKTTEQFCKVIFWRNGLQVQMLLLDNQKVFSPKRYSTETLHYVTLCLFIYVCIYILKYISELVPGMYLDIREDFKAIFQKIAIQWTNRVYYMHFHLRHRSQITKTWNELPQVLTRNWRNLSLQCRNPDLKLSYVLCQT